MNILTGRSIDRRTFLKGVGVSVALPRLDAMSAAGKRKSSADDPPTRFVAIEEVHGLAGCNIWGESQFLFAPEQSGRDFIMNPSNALISLEPYQDYLTIVSNTDVRMAEAFNPAEIGGDHFRSSAVFLTQSHPKQTQGSDLYVGTSMDQLYAQRFGQDTAIPSMQLCIENLDAGGGCTYNYSCAYTDSISWSAPNEPLPMIRDPRVAFDMMFGTGTTVEDRMARRQQRKSILDFISGQVSGITNQLSPEDRRRMDSYLTYVRELERRIEMVEQYNTSGEERQMPEAPAGVPDSFSEHMQIMFDIQVVALQTDMTRVISFKTGRDADNRVFPEAGTSTAFHPGSHHGGRESAILDFNAINQYRVGQLPYFVEKLKNTMDGDVSLLDSSLIMWGSPMGDANLHNHRRCPLFFLGKANGGLQGNLHIRAPEGTPMANAMLSACHILGMDDMESFGDSTGEVPLKYYNNL